MTSKHNLLQVQAIEFEKAYDTSFVPSLHSVPHTKIDAGSRSFSCTNLQPSTKYKLIVAAHTENRTGDLATIYESTYPVTVEGK